MNGRFPIHYAAMCGRLELLQWMWISGSEMEVKASRLTTFNGSTPLHVAVENEQLEIVEFLASNQAGIDSSDFEGNYPVHKAGQTGNIAIFQCLLDNESNPNARNNYGRSPFQEAVLAEKNELVVHFLHLCDHPTDLLFDASSYGLHEVVRVLIKQGEDPNSVDGIVCLSFMVEHLFIMQHKTIKLIL